MSRIVLAISAFFLLAAAHGPAAMSAALRQPSRPPAPFSPAGSPRLTLPLHQVALCRRSEKLCRMASYITWCCRADQACDTSTVGGCISTGP